MNPKELAAKFLGQMLSDTAFRASFSRIDKSDISAVASFLTQHLKLAEAPSRETVKAMIDNVHELKRPIVDALRKYSMEHYEAVQAAEVLGFTQE